ncbi:MAG: HAD hydrolase family protein, partial [Pseudomonadota bacterium]
MKIVVFTDLDATLLDSDTYSWAPARESLQALKESDASVILVSSKTFAEMESLHRELELHDPFVIENGGGIFFHRESSVLSHISNLSRHPAREYGRFVLLSLGTEYEGLVRSLAEISE